jgi:malic enzyme
MAHTFEELKGMTVAQLRDIAKDVQSEVLQGFMTMHKDHLLPALCKALNIEGHAQHVAKLADKSKVKAQIRDLKKQRDAAVAAHDAKKLAELRPLLHALRRKLRRAAK